jgi:cytosine/adenosine deaminase-related metal-dependent hydrolase
MRTLLRAAHVFTGEGPVLRNAGVLVEGGVILGVGRIADEAAVVTDLGQCVLMPGLVNPHTHLELSGCSCDPPSASFTDWILSFPARLGFDRGLTRDDVFPAATKAGIEQCLKFGVTTVGDISQQSDLTRPMIAESPLRCVSYGEVLGLAGRRARFDELMPRAVDRRYETGRLKVGLTPHAPYTVDQPSYVECVAAATQLDLPLATHLAETPDEREFLEAQAGPFRELWEHLGSWSEPVATFRGGPVEFARHVGLLDRPTLLAHVNYCDDDELGMLARGKASVVYCPRTHAYFGHPPHRFREMMRAGVNVAIGTDSCASSPDLDLVAELRLVHSLFPELPAESLFRMVTFNAARAIRREREVGSLAAGKAADLVVFPVRTTDPLTELLETTVPPVHVWIGGERVG